jgi:hypothetical protein
VLVVPPGIAAGLNDSPETWYGLTAKTAVAELPLKLADIVAEVAEFTSSVVTGKVADDEPAGTVTVAGTVATLVSELDRAMTSPLGPACPLNATVPVTAVSEPPTTLEGDSPTLETVAAVTVSVVVAGARLYVNDVVPEVSSEV